VVVAGVETGPVNNTLLSATCNLACGVLIPMPTFCACEMTRKKNAVTRNSSFMMVLFYGQILPSKRYHLSPKTGKLSELRKIMEKGEKDKPAIGFICTMKVKVYFTV
jgi:hypothetical protein